MNVKCPVPLRSRRRAVQRGRGLREPGRGRRVRLAERRRRGGGRRRRVGVRLPGRLPRRRRRRLLPGQRGGRRRRLHAGRGLRHGPHRVRGGGVRVRRRLHPGRRRPRLPVGYALLLSFDATQLSIISHLICLNIVIISCLQAWAAPAPRTPSAPRRGPSAWSPSAPVPVTTSRPRAETPASSVKNRP